MRSCAILVLLVGVAGCWVEFPDQRFTREFGVDKSRPDQQVDDLLKCAPDALLACTPDKQALVVCNATGFGTVTVNCSPYQCKEPERRCSGCNPGDPPTCSGTLKVTCNRFGIPVTTPCPGGCANGACL
jgi:hypothetical protein